MGADADDIPDSGGQADSAEGVGAGEVASSADDGKAGEAALSSEEGKWAKEPGEPAGSGATEGASETRRADSTLRQSLIEKTLTALLTLLVTTLGGGLISLTFTIYNRNAEHREEQRKARAVLGEKAEAEILEQLAGLMKALRAVQVAANRDYQNAEADPRDARTRLDASFKPQRDAWTSRIFVARNKVGRAFGADVALAIEDNASDRLVVDLCGRVVERKDKCDFRPRDPNADAAATAYCGTVIEPDRVCRYIRADEAAALAATERKNLDKAIEQLNLNNTGENGRNARLDADKYNLNKLVIAPQDFAASVRVASQLVEKMITCREIRYAEGVKAKALREGRQVEQPLAIDAAQLLQQTNSSTANGVARLSDKDRKAIENHLRCSTLDTLRFIINGRVNLAGVQEERIADDFLAAWTRCDRAVLWCD